MVGLFYLRPMQELLRNAYKFKIWEKNLLKNGMTIHQIEEVYAKYRPNGEVLFALVNVDATTPEGNKLLPICFLKGEVVSVLVCLIDRATRAKSLLLVKQRRVCTGDYIYEQPAGMVDADDRPLDVAVREVEEETGLRVSPDRVTLLNAEPYFPSTGTSDEAVYFYYTELELSRAEIGRLDAQTTGAAGEHEFIQTCVVPLEEAKTRITNVCGLLNIYLYLEKIGKNS